MLSQIIFIIIKVEEHMLSWLINNTVKKKEAELSINVFHVIVKMYFHVRVESGMKRFVSANVMTIILLLSIESFVLKRVGFL